MLHQVPDSPYRSRMLEVVQMQITLIDELCALSEYSVIDEAWLKSVWPSLPDVWVERFWINKKGSRANWISTLAAASVADKQVIRDLMTEQHRFAELYQTPSTVRLSAHNWEPPVFAAAKNLLLEFYDPLFYKNEGFPNSDGTIFHKEHFIFQKPKVCPYTDNFIQDTKLDHFLPKDQFPMLSCHPDNLIPCSTDSNSGSHKGKKVPLCLSASDQAKDWFHPRLRSARNTYQLTFKSGPGAPQPTVQFAALNPGDQPRLDNLNSTFGLSEFWGGFLDDEVQSVANDIEGWMRVNGVVPNEANIKHHVSERARQETEKIGSNGLSIVRSFFYQHISQTPKLLEQIFRICTQGT